MKIYWNALRLLILAGVVVFSVFPSRSRSLAAARQPSEPGIVGEIAGYKSWPKATPVPSWYDPSISVMCAPSTQQPVASGPHTNKYILVYVNETGRRALLQQKTPDFPEGSIVVKEKLPDASSRSPELLTVMLKRGKGFNPASGDWEFAVLDGTANVVIEQGKLENCASCHNTKKDSGFVFRSYLTPEAKAKLQ
ncbi:MAG TPA: cytochrome P460 family protein [Blastocatellia bacterium]|nr:cytochrome P460 family protein [Blastocatellia bacterium]